jgi:prepilin-type N-terminal cleavage/methylation domain-containing protein
LKAEAQNCAPEALLDCGDSSPFAGRRLHGGFTLLEIVIVIAIIAVFAGGAIGAMVYNASSRQLRRAGGEIESMAKRARAVAILRQTPYALVFFNGRIDLAPLAEVTDDDGEYSEPERTASADERDGDPTISSGRQLAPVHAEFVVDDGMTLGVRRWGSADWVVFDDERHRMVWRFDPNGLCEPISVRMEIDDGESWLEQDYHPLTAAVRDYSMEAK